MISASQHTQSQAAAPAASPFPPFRHSAFAVLWTATVISNVGGWMYSAASGWLMTSLNPDPLIVSLVQVATTLPMFLFALPAGALADIVDRRKFLVVAEIIATVLSALYAAIVSAADSLLGSSEMLGVVDSVLADFFWLAAYSQAATVWPAPGVFPCGGGGKVGKIRSDLGDISRLFGAAKTRNSP
jgi:MFS family permease